MKMLKRLAKRISFEPKKRRRKDVEYIVIHYTGNDDDTARGNLNYFAKLNNREAGAHFFVDKAGVIGRSIPMNRVAYSVGGFFNKLNGAGSYYKKCTNANSVSIELCDCVKNYSTKQAEATKRLVKYIRKYCPNAKTIIRHWDVNGKSCPGCMTGKNNKKWIGFKNRIEG